MKWSFMIYYFLKNRANYGWMEKNIRGILGGDIETG